MWLTLAFFALLFNGLAAFGFKVNAMNKGSTTIFLFGFFLMGSLASLLYCWYTNAWAWNISILIAGVVIGLGASVGNLLYTKAVQVGPAGLTAMISHSHVVLIVLMSIVLYQEKLTHLEGIAICFIILAVLLLPFDPNQKLRITRRSWYLFIAIIFIGFFLRNGGLKITEELSLNNSPIILVSYLVGLGWFTIPLLSQNLNSGKPHKQSLVYGLCAGILSFGVMQTQAIALTMGPASIIMPIASANGVLVALLSYWVYRERFSLFQFISFCFILVSVILLRI